jgi:hypothetical protein
LRTNRNEIAGSWDRNPAPAQPCGFPISRIHSRFSEGRGSAASVGFHHRTEDGPAASADPTTEGDVGPDLASGPWLIQETGPATSADPTMKMDVGPDLASGPWHIQETGPATSADPTTEIDVGPDLASGPWPIRKRVRRQAPTPQRR